MSAAAEVFVERPCVDCGEPTFNEQRCRECNLDYLFDAMACQTCGDEPRLVVKADSFLGAVLQAHDDVGACPFMAL